MIRQIANNKTNGQFESIVNGHKATLRYRVKEVTLFYMHTLVPKEIEGRGISSDLTKFALNYARANNFKIVVYCPFVILYVKKHIEYLNLLNH